MIVAALSILTPYTAGTNDYGRSQKLYSQPATLLYFVSQSQRLLYKVVSYQISDILYCPQDSSHPTEYEGLYNALQCP